MFQRGLESGVLRGAGQLPCSASPRTAPAGCLYTTHASREKPHPYDDTAGGWRVIVPDVTATGLFVEHFQKTEAIWKGQNGRTIFFQNELPYDVPDQFFCTNDGVPGYAAYKLAHRVKTHEAWGLWRSTT